MTGKQSQTSSKLALHPTSSTIGRLLLFRQKHPKFDRLVVACLPAAVLVALLVGGEIAGPKVAFNASPPITAH
jgi:hypothetical protein